MKKIIFFLILTILAFGSCKKDQKPGGTEPEAGKTYKVKYNLSGLKTNSFTGNKTVNSLQTDSVTGIPSSVETITYFAINPSGVVVSQISQNRDMDGFGVINDELPAGTYTIEMVATKKAYTVTKDMVTNSSNVLSDGNEFWGDTFATRFTLTVTNDDISKDVSLHRIVGQITLKILDVMPSNVLKIRINLANDADSYFFETDGTTAPTGSNHSKMRSVVTTVPSSARGKTNYQISFIVLETNKKHSITIFSYDNKGVVLSQSTVGQIGVQRNTNTILSGKLYGSDATFDVSLNHEWSNYFNYDF